jgi:hypothetical protein
VRTSATTHNNQRRPAWKNRSPVEFVPARLFPPFKRPPNGDYLIWLEPGGSEPAEGDARPARELQRRDSEAGEDGP